MSNACFVSEGKYLLLPEVRGSDIVQRVVDFKRQAIVNLLQYILKKDCRINLFGALAAFWWRLMSIHGVDSILVAPYFYLRLQLIKKGRQCTMKKAFWVGLVVLFFGMGFIATTFAQTTADTADVAQAIAQGKSGNFKGEVVKTDPAAMTMTVKLAKGEKTADTRYASYNGAFNAARDLKPGDKIAGLWSEVKGKIFITYIVKMN